MRNLSVFVFSAALLSQLACVQTIDPEPTCDAEQAWKVEGCGGGETTTFADGCYESCTTVGESCASGGTCTNVTVDPCVCAAGEDCCDACGSEELICL